MSEKKEEAVVEVDYSKWNIFKKLTEARVLVAEKMVKKSGVNSYAGYKYFTSDDILSPMKPIFKQVGLTGVFKKEQAVINPENGIQLTPAMWTLKIYNNDRMDDKPIIFTFDEADAGTKGQLPIQAKGSERTYAMRYLYMDALEIAEEDATEINAGNPDEKAQPVPATMPKVRMISTPQMQILQKAYPDPTEVFKWAGITKWEELTAELASQIIRKKKLGEEWGGNHNA